MSTRDDGVATLAIGERLGSATVSGMLEQLNAALAADASVIVVEGEPGRFCLGMDFSEVLAAPSELAQLARLLDALFRCPRPTLAVIDGPALGGGLGVAAACDVVLASDRSTAGLPEALYGLLPAIIRPALLTRLSHQQLRMLVFSCHARGADEARALGLFDQVVAADALAGAKRSMVRQLRRASSKTVAGFRQWDCDALEQQLYAGVADTARSLADPEIIEAMRMFTAEEGLPWMR